MQMTYRYCLFLYTHRKQRVGLKIEVNGGGYIGVKVFPSPLQQAGFRVQYRVSINSRQ